MRTRRGRRDDTQPMQRWTPAEGELPPGSREAARLLTVLSPAALGTIPLLVHRAREDWSVGEPVLVVVTLLAIGTAALLVWNLLCLVGAFLATGRLLPPGAARALAGVLTRIGTGASREILARRGTAAVLGTGLVLCLAPTAMASPSVDLTGALVGATSPTPDPEPTPAVPEDLSWGAPTLPAGTGGEPPTSPSSHGVDPCDAFTGGAPGSCDPQLADTGARADHMVAPGESLWSIAALHLGPGADDAAIAHLWPLIHSANAGVIGEDPHLIRPGMVLEIPGGRP